MQKEHPHRPQKIAPSAVTAQELAALLQGEIDIKSGEELLSTLVQLATERMLQEALAQDQAEVLKALVADLRDAATFEEGQRRSARLGDEEKSPVPEACRC
jgi:hypothetical protein